jgi:hypothetical protein
VGLRGLDVKMAELVVANYHKYVVKELSTRVVVDVSDCLENLLMLYRIVYRLERLKYIVLFVKLRVANAKSCNEVIFLEAVRTRLWFYAKASA